MTADDGRLPKGVTRELLKQAQKLWDEAQKAAGQAVEELLKAKAPNRDHPELYTELRLYRSNAMVRAMIYLGLASGVSGRYLVPIRLSPRGRNSRMPRR